MADNVWNHPKVGERVRYIGAPDGERRMGEGLNPTRWLRGGAVGTVVRVIEGYPSHRCLDHDGGFDCTCGDDSGFVRAMKQSPVIAYQTLEGSPLERCIDPEDEGTDWERWTPEMSE